MEPLSSRLPAGGDKAPAPFRLAVLNPGGRDREQAFPDGAGTPGDLAAAHPPINYHAYAACTGGSFHARTSSAIATGLPVLVLLRSDLRAGLRCVRQLKEAGRTVAVTFKEAGALQVAARLTDPRDVECLIKIVLAADGCVAPAPWLHAFYQGLGHHFTSKALRRKPPTALIPTPYPVEDARWNFAVPNEERRGIFVGTREWKTPGRQHLAALSACLRLHEQTGEPVTVINTEFHGVKSLVPLGFHWYPDSPLQIVEGPLPYVEYLRLMARHKLVFQLDRGGVPGQVAGDALLCRVPCVGGDGAVEQIAFPGLSGHGRTPDELVDLAEALLRDPARRERAANEAHVIALERLSFGAVAGQLRTFFEQISLKVGPTGP